MELSLFFLRSGSSVERYPGVSIPPFVSRDDGVSVNSDGRRVRRLPGGVRDMDGMGLLAMLLSRGKECGRGHVGILREQRYVYISREQPYDYGLSPLHDIEGQWDEVLRSQAACECLSVIKW